MIKFNLSFLLVINFVVCQAFIYERNGKNIGYKVSSSSMTWIEAKKFCNDDGGNLVQILNEHDQSAVEMFLLAVDPTGENYFWTGLTDVIQEGHWIWVPSGEEATYFNWRGGGGPDNYGGMEHFVQIFAHTREWNDYSNDPLSYRPWPTFALCQYTL